MPIYKARWTDKSGNVLARAEIPAGSLPEALYAFAEECEKQANLQQAVAVHIVKTS